MKTLPLVIILLISCRPVSAQSDSPSPGSPAGRPERPLSNLPYTPSLDLGFLDRAVDPCVDFYRYACGNWIKQNPIPPDQSRWDVYSKLEDENQRFLWGLLEEASRPARDRSPAQQKIGDYFNACMDETAVEEAGPRPLESHLEEIAALVSLKDLPALIAHLHLEASPGNSSNALFGFSSNQDFADSTRVIAFATAGGLGLPDRDYYIATDAKSQEARGKYVEHVRKMFILLGDSPEVAQSEARTVMEIETAMAGSSLTRVEKRDPYKLFHKFSRARLKALTPSFGWDDYLTTIGFAGVSDLNVTEPEFFRQLEAQFRTRTLAEWKTYLRWHLVHGRAPYLSSPFVMADFEFYGTYLQGVQRIKPRWKRCVEFVDRDMGEALGHVFVEKTFSSDAKVRALAMTNEIDKAMEADIRQLTWMSEKTRRRALEKLRAMVNKIGYPDKWRDYSPLSVERADFAGNVTRAAVFESNRQLAKIGKPLDRTEWQMTPPTVNASYNPQLNDLTFPAGVLQPPLFDPKMDDAPNYGNTGATIGHELTHGFDDEGRQFDGKGNLRDWWTRTDGEEFKRRASCVSEQYAQYTVVDDIKINSKLTLGEDVADLGGTTLAYIAWKSATGNQDLKQVDGQTPDQRFFLGMAQWACGDERPESKRLSAITDPHSPLEYRINGVVSDMPEFARAYSCKPGQPMVRAHPCRVW